MTIRTDNSSVIARLTHELDEARAEVKRLREGKDLLAKQLAYYRRDNEKLHNALAREHNESENAKDAARYRWLRKERGYGQDGRVDHTGDIAIPDEVVDLRLLLECRHERNVLQKICAERSDEIERLCLLLKQALHHVEDAGDDTLAAIIDTQIGSDSNA